MKSGTPSARLKSGVVARGSIALSTRPQSVRGGGVFPRVRLARVWDREPLLLGPSAVYARIVRLRAKFYTHHSDFNRFGRELDRHAHQNSLDSP